METGISHDSHEPKHHTKTRQMAHLQTGSKYTDMQIKEHRINHANKKGKDHHHHPSRI